MGLFANCDKVTLPTITCRCHAPRQDSDDIAGRKNLPIAGMEHACNVANQMEMADSSQVEWKQKVPNDASLVSLSSRPDGDSAALPKVLIYMVVHMPQ